MSWDFSWNEISLYQLLALYFRTYSLHPRSLKGLICSYARLNLENDIQRQERDNLGKKMETWSIVYELKMQFEIQLKDEDGNCRLWNTRSKIYLNFFFSTKTLVNYDVILLIRPIN